MMSVTELQLILYQLIIGTPFGHQFFVGAYFYNPPTIKHHYL